MCMASDSRDPRPRVMPARRPLGWKGETAPVGTGGQGATWGEEPTGGSLGLPRASPRRPEPPPTVPTASLVCPLRASASSCFKQMVWEWTVPSCPGVTSCSRGPEAGQAQGWGHGGGLLGALWPPRRSLPALPAAQNSYSATFHVAPENNHPKQTPSSANRLSTA